MRIPMLASRGALLLLVMAAACAQEAPAPTAPIDNREVVETLASDAYEGRLTGTDGIARAADYIVDRIETLGAQPMPGASGFRLPFRFTAGVSDGGTTLAVRSPAAPGADADPPWAAGDVQALSLSENGSVSGPLVFVGYGLAVPETDGFSYDSFATLDVTDKIAVMLRYFPEDTEGELRATLSRYSGPRYKAFAARERGAKGIIVITGPRSPNAGKLVPMTFDTAVAGSGIVAASVTGEVAEALLRPVGRTLDDIQASFDTGNPHVTGFDVPGVEVTLATEVTREERTGYNVVGLLPATEDTEVPKPYLMLGAHYDHLGHGTGGNSLARDDEAGQIHNGADDNASGVAAVLWAGAELAAVTRPRGVILAFWSGEEIGLLGSADFVETSTIPMDQIAAYLNFDMVGRLRENRLSVQAVGTSSIWRELVEDLNATVDGGHSASFDLQFVSDPYLPTDVISLNRAEVPSVAFFTGSHDDYHRPTDDPGTVNYEGLERIARLGAAVAREVATRPDPPDFIKAEPNVQASGRGPIRIFTGTIPDYSDEAEGLLLAGVVSGGPAEAAGLAENDVVIELAGQTIANIYDYTYALDLLKVGEPVRVVFMRDGERRETTLTPEARE